MSASLISSHYHCRPVAIATQHGKEAVLRDVLSAAGLHLIPVQVDTDSLGTFTGEVPRGRGLIETGVAKARLGAAASGLALNLASEGAFAPDPDTGLVVMQREVVVLLDTTTDITVVGRAFDLAPWAQAWVIGAGDDPAAAVGRLDLRVHRLTVRPDPATPAPAGTTSLGITKEVADLDGLREAVHRAAGHSPRVRIETDLRSHVCPMRHAVMREAARDLLTRLRTPCPSCGVGGYGPEDAKRGAPCRDCRTPSEAIAAWVDRCPHCGATSTRPAEPATADPSRCPSCNP